MTNFIGIEHAEPTSSGASCVVSVPAGTLDGDLMVLFKVSRADTTPSGWTSIASPYDPNGTGNYYLHAFYRIASSEPANYTVNAPDVLNMGAIAVYRGVSVGTLVQRNASQVFNDGAGVKHAVASFSAGSDSVPAGFILYCGGVFGNFLRGFDGTPVSTVTDDPAVTNRLTGNREDGGGGDLQMGFLDVADVAVSALSGQPASTFTGDYDAANNQNCCAFLEISGFTTSVSSGSWSVILGPEPEAETLGDNLVNKKILTAKGDLIVATASARPARQGVGANFTVLSADSAQTNGMKWVPIASLVPGLGAHMTDIIPEDDPWGGMPPVSNWVPSQVVPAAVSTVGAAGTSTTKSNDDHVHAHEAAHIQHDTTWAAKGDLIVATANDTAAVVTIGATSAYPRVVGGTLAWVAASAATPQPIGTAAAGTAANPPSADDHVHGGGTVTRTVWITPMWDGTTPAVPVIVGTAPDSAVVFAGALTATGTTGGQFVTNVPNDWSSGIIQYTIYVQGAADGVSHSIRWSTDVLEIIPGTTAINAAGTTTAFTGTARTWTANVCYTEAIQTLLTPTTAGNLLRVNIQRLGDIAADNYTGNARFVGILLTYTANR